MTDYQITHLPRKKLLSDLQEKLDRLSVDLEEKGIDLFVVIVPNKSTIYSQYMPDEIPVIGEKRDIDVFVEYLKTSGKTRLVDLREVLHDASDSESVYYKTDTHWNDLGAYYGYLEIMNKVSALHPELKPRPLSDFEYIQAGDSTRDLAGIMGLLNHTEENWILAPKYEVNVTETTERLPNEDLFIRTATNGDSSLPSLLVFQDSFYISMAHFIEPHFSHIKSIPFSEKNKMSAVDWIQREHPDIVIIEFVERYLDDSLPVFLSTE